MPTTRDLFARHSLRCTQQRMAVYETLRECEGHPTADEIFRLVRPRTQKVSLATVYNALDALSAAGLVRRMPTSNGCCRYDADTSPHPHVCFRDSDDIANVPPDLGARLLAHLPPVVLDRIGSTLGVEIDGVSVRLLASRRGGGGPPR